MSKQSTVYPVEEKSVSGIKRKERDRPYPLWMKFVRGPNLWIKVNSYATEEQRDIVMDKLRRRHSDRIELATTKQTGKSFP